MQWRRHAHNQDQRGAMEAFAAAMEKAGTRGLTAGVISGLLATHGSDGSALVGGCGRTFKHNNPENNTMKKLIFTLTLAGALALGGQSAFAEAKKKPAEPAAPAAEKPKADASKPLPFHTIVDSIDAAGKSFSHKNKDGKEVKNVVTAKTELKNDGKDAKFEDIKVGDEVTGTHLKKSDTEYEVVKTTYIGAPKKKAEKPAGEKTPEAPAKPKTK
jgi:hypothetical protein